MVKEAMYWLVFCVLAILFVAGACFAACWIAGCAQIDDALGGPARPYQHDPWARDHPDTPPLYLARPGDAGGDR